MGIKRIIDTDFWNDDKVMEMFSPEDKYFMLYLLSNPHTSQLGIYAINPKLMAFELGYSMESVKVLIERFEKKYDIIKYSETTKEVAIKNYLKYSIVTGGKPVYDCLIKEIKKVKDTSLIFYVYDNIKNNKYNNNTVKDLIEYINNNYNDIYNDNDNDNERLVDESWTSRDSSLQAEAEHCPFEKIKNLYHSICKSYPQIRTIDGNRKKAVSARWRVYKDLNIFEELFTIAENSDFLKGNNDRNWNADFDWFMKPTNFSKVLEHKYDSSNKPVKKSKFDVLRELYEEAENEEAGNIEGYSVDMFKLPEHKG